MAAVVERMITSATLREAIRLKLRTGVSREMIAFLIIEYAPAGLRSERVSGHAPRLTVERIPHGRRTAFLAALSELSRRHRIAKRSPRPVAKRSLASWLAKGMAASSALHPAEANGNDPS